VTGRAQGRTEVATLNAVKTRMDAAGGGEVEGQHVFYLPLTRAFIRAPAFERAAPSLTLTESRPFLLCGIAYSIFWLSGLIPAGVSPKWLNSGTWARRPAGRLMVSKANGGALSIGMDTPRTTMSTAAVQAGPPGRRVRH